DAVAKLTPHSAAVHRWRQLHPELQGEYERAVAEILQQHIRNRVLDEVRMLGRRLGDQLGDLGRACAVGDAHRHFIAHKVIAQSPVNHLHFEKLAVGDEDFDAVTARDQRIAKSDAHNLSSLVIDLDDVTDANAAFAKKDDAADEVIDERLGQQ